MWNRLKALADPYRMSDEQFEQERARILEKAPIPVFWLFGKTGSGKTSIIREFTGASEAEIGNGFRPQTRFSHEYGFPSEATPVVRFLDTRGLGESEYDPAEDIDRFAELGHVLIVTVRVADRAIGSVVEPLRRIRKAHPMRPVVLVPTCLHESYPQQPHPQPDPFSENSSSADLPGVLHEDLERTKQEFAGLFDEVVPIDFTRAEDGYSPVNFGKERLEKTLAGLLPAAYRQALLGLHETMQSLKNLNERRVMPYVLSYSTLAATAAAVPTPWLDIPVVLSLQMHLVYRIAAIYGHEVDRTTIQAMAGTMTGRLALRMLVKESLKMVPFVGSAANAALVFAYTFALGKAWMWYFGERKAGNAPSARDLERIWEEELATAREVWLSRNKAAENQP